MFSSNTGSSSTMHTSSHTNVSWIARWLLYLLQQYSWSYKTYRNHYYASVNAAASSTTNNSTSTSASADNAINSNMIRDIYTGKFTVTGIHYLQQGRTKCSVREIHYNRIDPLQSTTLCSYEIRWLALLLMRSSNALNNTFKLPKSNRWLQCSWMVLFFEYLNGNIDLMSVVYESFRFNIRSFACIRIVGMMVLFAVYWTTLMEWLSVLVATSVVVPVLMIMYFNTTRLVQLYLL